MKTFDLLGPAPADKRVLFERREFKLRIIDLAPGQNLPRCEMSSHVVFVCLEGQAEVNAGGERAIITGGQCVVSGPAPISMIAGRSGARLSGIQIASGTGEAAES